VTAAGLTALITALATLLGTVVALIQVFRKVKQVHVLVNSNLTAVMDKLGIEQDRSAQLTSALDAGGVPVPPKPPAREGS
jgi:hypothetical protein